jgi:hypothetical protein
MGDRSSVRRQNNKEPVLMVRIGIVGIGFMGMIA